MRQWKAARWKPSRKKIDTRLKRGEALFASPLFSGATTSTLSGQYLSPVQHYSLSIFVIPSIYNIIYLISIYAQYLLFGRHVMLN
jgi:hypothetical protein